MHKPFIASVVFALSVTPAVTQQTPRWDLLEVDKSVLFDGVDIPVPEMKGVTVDPSLSGSTTIGANEIDGTEIAKNDFNSTNLPVESKNEIEIAKPELDEPIFVFKPIVHHDILFDVGKSTLKSQSTPIIAGIADNLREYPFLQIMIEGHTDWDGTEEDNQTLSENRAAAVKAALIDMGIDPGRLSTRGRGELRPMVPNDSVSNKAINRRVVIIPSQKKVQI